jgi:preprotein translocase subunit SecE
VAKKDEAEVGKIEAKDTKPSKESKEVKKTEDSQSGGFNISVFWQGIREELDKVVWPTRQQLISESIAVILMVTLSATLIYLVDNFFVWAAKSPYLFGQ